MSVDPTWPIMDEAVSFIAGAQTPAPFPFWLSVLGRTNDVSSGQSIQRGRQYELQVVQTGEFSPTLSNGDGAFSAMNTSSPYYANLQPYCAYRRRAQFPPTVNLLTQGQATGGTLPSAIASGTLVSSVPNFIYSSLPTPSYVSVANGGFNGYTVAVEGPTSAITTGLIIYAGFSVVPGQSHAFSFYCAQDSGGTTTVPVQAQIVWIDCTGAAISNTTGSTVTLTAWSTTYNWQQVTVVGTPPSNAAGAKVQINNTATGHGNLLVGGAQFELASAPTAFVQPGVWY